jgi:hypothetical protein
LAVVYETITAKLPDAEETEDFLKMVTDLESIYRADPGLADRLCEGVSLHEGVPKGELAAWTMVVNTIYNLDITKTRS